jgi:hypothetical protein
VTARQSANGRVAAREPADWAALEYRPAEGTPLLACRRCGGRYFDDREGRQAHDTVFGHHPRPVEPAEASDDV